MLVPVLDFCNTTIQLGLTGSCDPFHWYRRRQTPVVGRPNKPVMPDSRMKDTDRDRERSPAKERQRITSRDVQEHEEDMFKLKALGNLKTWRGLQLSDREVYNELRESYDEHRGRIALSFIATKTLVPGADDRRD